MARKRRRLVALAGVDKVAIAGTDDRLLAYCRRIKGRVRVELTIVYGLPRVPEPMPATDGDGSVLCHSTHSRSPVPP
jgi:hypothetical protein